MNGIVFGSKEVMVSSCEKTQRFGRLWDKQCFYCRSVWELDASEWSLISTEMRMKSKEAILMLIMIWNESNESDLNNME